MEKAGDGCYPYQPYTRESGTDLWPDIVSLKQKKFDSDINIEETIRETEGNFGYFLINRSRQQYEYLRSRSISV